MKINNFVLLDFNNLKQFVIKYVYFITSPGLKISSLYPLNSYDQVLKCKILQIFVMSFCSILHRIAELRYMQYFDISVFVLSKYYCTAFKQWILISELNYFLRVCSCMSHWQHWFKDNYKLFFYLKKERFSSTKFPSVYILSYEDCSLDTESQKSWYQCIILGK